MMKASNVRVQEEYIDFLRGLFKGTEPTKFLHLAFLTGILPIKKVRTQSALNNFEEVFTMGWSLICCFPSFHWIYGRRSAGSL